VVPLVNGAVDDDDLGTFGDEDEPLDPDVDPDRISSVEADMQASTDGTKDGDLERP
jgi:hypothetical protein